jgi:hypothetical protein
LQRERGIEVTEKLHDTIHTYPWETVEASRMLDRIETLTADRNALAAQVAVLVAAVETLHSGMRTFPFGSVSAARSRIDRMMAHTLPALDNIPAAAARYLAAGRACELIDRDQRAGRIPAFDLGDSDAAHGLNQWRKACEGGGV